jgi:hypothetical protein
VAAFVRTRLTKNISNVLTNIATIIVKPPGEIRAAFYLSYLAYQGPLQRAENKLPTFIREQRANLELLALTGFNEDAVGVVTIVVAAFVNPHVSDLGRIEFAFPAHGANTGEQCSARVFNLHFGATEQTG